MQANLSAVVIAYNRATIIGTCLRALRFADEVIVVDKSSTDATPQIAARHADRVITVPWTPTVEDTRAFAVTQCTGDWILCLDDDECLSPESAAVLRAEIATPRADIYCLPLRHYILGVHDPAAYYWPEHHPRLFRRGAVAFAATVHGGMRLCSDQVIVLPPESGVVIHHLSHRDVREWLDKCNRYTERPDRVRVDHGGQDLVAFAHAQIDHWQARTRDATPGGYASVAALLRALYDIIDRLKTWEEERGLDGTAAFGAICTALDAAYDTTPAGRRFAGIQTQAIPADASAEAGGVQAALGARITELRARCEVTAAEAARLTAALARCDTELAAAQRERDEARQALRIERERLAAIEASTSWRATAGVRQLAERARRVARSKRQT